MGLLLALALFVQTPAMKITTIAKSGMSHITTARQVVVHSNLEWIALWKEHSGDDAAPKVAFGKVTVLAVFLGQRTSGGYSVEIIGTRKDGNTLVVLWNERKPAADTMSAMVMTAPMHVASIPLFTGDIRFEKADK